MILRFTPIAALTVALLASAQTESMGAEGTQASPGTKAEDAAWSPLFNGRDLTGWVNVNCAPNTFTVRDGMIVSTGKPTGVMRTTRHYENFIVELEWKHIHPNGNAGLFLYSEPLTAPGVPFAKGIEVQIIDGNHPDGLWTGHGDIFSIHGASMIPDRPHPQGWERCLPSELRANPAGQWNHYRVESRDGRVTLAVNGKVVSGASQCRPRKGYLCLESEGSECHFRNIRIQELPSSNPPADQVASLDQGFHSLYTGIDLSGWKESSGKPPTHWSSSDWVLKNDGKKESRGNELWTEKEYGDFVMICDWRLTGKPERRNRPVLLPSGAPAKDASGEALELPVSDAGDSGIFLRGVPKGEINIWCWPSGSGELYRVRLDEKASAEARAAAVPLRKADRPPGQWNRFIITLRGDRVTVELNGETVIKNSVIPGLPARGPIGFQHHGEAVEFANIYIKPL